MYVVHTIFEAICLHALSPIGPSQMIFSQLNLCWVEFKLDKHLSILSCQKLWIQWNVIATNPQWVRSVRRVLICVRNSQKKSIRTYWVWQFVRVCNFCFLFSPHLLHNKYFLSCMVIRIPITKNQIWQDCNLSWQRSQEGPRPISQTLISSFVQGGTGWALWNDLQQIWALNIWQEEIHATDVKTWELLTMHSDKHSRYKPQKGGEPGTVGVKTTILDVSGRNWEILPVARNDWLTGQHRGSDRGSTGSDPQMQQSTTANKIQVADCEKVPQKQYAQS